MKELSIEQKAKAYDEALERMKSRVKGEHPECFTEAQKAAEFIFPELKESEDEKIRKEIMEYVKNTPAAPGGHIEQQVLSRWIAWLEKQEGCECIKKDWLEHIKQSWYKEGFIDGKYSDGTSKEWTKNDAATLKELIDFLENGTAKLQHDLTRYANWLKIQLTPIKKQGESKSAGKMQVSEKLYEHIRNTCACIDDALSSETLADVKDYLSQANYDAQSAFDMIEKQGEQNPTDNDMKEALRTEYEKGRADAIAQMQKPWSEEDERIRQCLIQDQEEALDDVYNDKYGHSEIISDLEEMYHERIDWLKSLKQRIGWKPSDEQITVLELASKYERVFTPKQIDILIGLKEQLKKLKGE